LGSTALYSNVIPAGPIHPQPRAFLKMAPLPCLLEQRHAVGGILRHGAEVTWSAGGDPWRI